MRFGLRRADAGLGDGGKRPAFSGWVMLGIAALAVFLSGPAQTYGVSVFIDPMLEDGGWSRSFFSTAYAIGTLASAAAVVYAGHALDRFGSRLVLSVGAVLFVIALLIMGWVSSAPMLILGLILLRASGQGVVSLAARTLVPRWFVRKRGRALSIVGIGASLSIATIPPVNAAIIDWLGWRDAWRVNAAVILLVLVPMVAIAVRNSPELVGQHPDGVHPDARPEDGKHSPAQSFAEPEPWTLKEAMRSAAFWLLLPASIVPSLVVTGLTFSQVSLFDERGLSTTTAATMFTVESLVALPTTLLAGWLNDRVPSRYVLAASQVFLFAATIWILLTHSVSMALVYGVLRGLSSGLLSVSADSAWPAYFGRAYIGSIRGVTTAIGIAGAAIGPLPLSLAFDALGTYDVALIGLAVLPVLATVAAIMARPPQRHPRAAVATATSVTGASR